MRWRGRNPPCTTLPARVCAPRYDAYLDALSSAYYLINITSRVGGVLSSSKIGLGSDG